MYRIRVDIYEVGTPYPVVRHEFLGRNRDEALGYFKAHQMTDTFLNSMIRFGRWRDVRGRAEVTEMEVP